MKKLIGILSLGLLAASIASATASSNPRAYCRSDDGRKVVRVKPTAFGNNMQAEVYHKGAIQYILKCEFDPSYLYYCTDQDPTTPRVFTLEQDGVTGVYEGNQQTTPLNCRLF